MIFLLCYLICFSVPSLIIHADTSKPIYLILFEKEKKIELVKDLIEKKQNQFEFRVESLKDLQITNDPVEIETYLKTIPNLGYVLFMGNMKPKACTINLLDDYPVTIETDFLISNLPIGRWPFNIPVPVVTNKLELDQFLSSGIFPIGQFKQYLGHTQEGCWNSRGINLAVYGEDLKKNFVQKNLKFTTLYETEGLNPDGKPIGQQGPNSFKPDFPLDKTLEIFNNSNLSFVASSALISPFDKKNNLYICTYFSSPQRIIWVNDVNKNYLADYNVIPKLSEIQISSLFPDDPETLEKKERIVFLLTFFNKDDFGKELAKRSTLVISPNPKNRVTQLPLYTGLKNGNLTNCAILSDILSASVKDLRINTSIGNFIHQVLPSLYNNSGNDIDDYYYIKYPIMSLEIYGDPSVSLSEFFKLPQIELEPEKLDKELIIDMGYKDNYTFSIKNTGEANLKWKIASLPFFIETDKLEGENEPQTSSNIKLIRKETQLLVAPKERSGTLIIETDDPSRNSIEIKIIAKGLF